MNEKKTVYNTLFESQEPKRVELGVVDDLVSYAKSGPDGFDELAKA